MQFCFVHYTASDHNWIISEIGLLLETDWILDAIPASDCLSPSALKIRNHLYLTIQEQPKKIQKYCI